MSRIDVGPRQIQQVVVAAHLAVPGVEARAAIALLVELSDWIIVPIAPSSTRMRSEASFWISLRVLLAYWA